MRHDRNRESSERDLRTVMIAMTIIVHWRRFSDGHAHGTKFAILVACFRETRQYILYDQPYA